MTPGRDHVGRRLRVAPSVCAMASVWAGAEIVAAIALRPKATVPAQPCRLADVLERLFCAPRSEGTRACGDKAPTTPAIPPPGNPELHGTAPRRSSDQLSRCTRHLQREGPGFPVQAQGQASPHQFVRPILAELS